jgi:hypothetical protein
MKTNEQPIRAINMQVGRGDWRLIIPGGAPDGEDVEFHFDGGIRSASPSVAPNLGGLVACLDRKMQRIISDRDEYNAEAGRLRGQIEHLRWQLATTSDPRWRTSATSCGRSCSSPFRS